VLRGRPRIFLRQSVQQVHPNRNPVPVGQLRQGLVQIGTQENLAVDVARGGFAE